MEQFYYTDGTNNIGPFKVDELKGMNLTPETLVWGEGMDEWKPAGMVSELSVLFYTPPPPAPATPVAPPVYSAPAAPPPPAPQQYMAPPPQPVYNQQHKQYSATSANQKPPKTWLVESILATILCCLPFGIIGILNATKVESKFTSGDIEGALKASKDAGKWTKIAAITGASVYLIYIILMIAGVGVGFSSLM